MNITITPGSEADLPDITAIYNEYIRETTITFDTHDWSTAQRAEWFKQFTADGTPYRLVVAKDGAEVIGFAYNGKFREKLAYSTSSEITIYLKRDQQRRGLGSKLYETLLEMIRQTPLHRLYAAITLPNDASIALHKKFGFQQVGLMDEAGYKHDAYRSVALLEKRL